MTVKVSKPAINVREELADLRKPTGVAGEAMLRAETPQEQFNLIGAGRRNIFINGDYQISQRGDYTTEVDAANDSYFVDRWKIRSSKGNASYMKFQVITNDLPPHLSYGRVVKCSANASYTTTEHMGFRQLIENYQELAGKTVTYSAWVKSNVPTTIWILQEGGTNVSDISTPHSGNGQWELLTLTSTIRGSGNTSILSYITTYGNALSGGDYHMSTQHQLEVGKVATPFEHRSYGEELALCQRYFEKPAFGRVTGYHTATVRAGYQFKVTKRADPTVTIASAIESGGSSISLSAGNITKDNMSINGSVGSASSGIQAQLEIDAEL